VIDAFATAIQ